MNTQRVLAIGAPAGPRDKTVASSVVAQTGAFVGPPAAVVVRQSKTVAAPPPAVISGYIGGAHQGKPISFSPSRRLVGCLAWTFAAAVLVVLTYRRVRRRRSERLRKATSKILRCKAEKTLVRFVAAAAHRHRAMLKAVINLQALARGAAVRRGYRCLARQRACALILLQTRWRAHAAARRYRARTTAALASEEFCCRAAALHFRAWRARLMLTRLAAHVAAKRRNREAFDDRALGRFLLPQRVEAGGDMQHAASIDVTHGFADASGIRDADATGGLCSTPRSERMAGNSVRRRNETPHSTYHQRKERKNMKDAKPNRRANKVAHKLQLYSSDRFNDKLLEAGRGCASGRISCHGDAPQEKPKGHSCTAKTTPAPPETSGAVLPEKTEKPGRKVRSRTLDRC